MVLQEKKIKIEEQILPQYIKTLKNNSYSNPDIINIKRMIIEQMEESFFNTSQIAIELDENKDGILDLIQEDRLKYIFEGLPTTEPMRQYFKKIEQYFTASERQKEKLIKKLKEVLDYADKTREIVKLVPIESTSMGQDEVERFKAKIRGQVIAYKNETTKSGRGVLLMELKNQATTDERKVWINSVAMEEINEEILK